MFNTNAVVRETTARKVRMLRLVDREVFGNFISSSSRLRGGLEIGPYGEGSMVRFIRIFRSEKSVKHTHIEELVILRPVWIALEAFLTRLEDN